MVAPEAKLKCGGLCNHDGRLQAIGQLASGIAHELNTPIQFVGDSLHFLTEACEDIHTLISAVDRVSDDLTKQPATADAGSALAAAKEDADWAYLATEIPKALERCREGVHRVATIVRAMKEFGHPGSVDKTPADLNRALTTTLTVARNEYKTVADVELNLGDIPLVPCVVGEINQVFLNLIVNAAHAIGETAHVRGKGMIKIESFVEGEYVVVTIADNGSGISKENMKRIFEPFFTTKRARAGTGQGLALSLAMVERHGGNLAVESAVGRGTTFTMTLPIGN